MDKYAVQTDQDKTKTASSKTNCPKCGREIVTTISNVLHCPDCGTEPFEKKDG